MSFKAMAWATEQEITKTSPQSHLLLIMASFANEKNECYPSISTIEKKTRLSHNTIRKCIKELIDFGLVVDTKKTSQFNTKIYQLNLDCVGAIESNLNDTPTKFGSTTNFDPPTNFGMTPLPNLNDTPTNFGAKPLPNLVDNPINNPININHKETCHSETHTHENQTSENSQNSSQTKPTTKNSTSVNSKSKKSKDYLTVDDLMNLKLSDFKFTDKDFKDYPNLGDWIFENMDYQIAKDYLAMRTNKLTMTAIKSSVKQASIAGLDLSQALEVCITYGKNGWQTFKADWYFNAQKAPAWQPTQPTNRMDELRHMANTNPTNVFVDDLPPNFHALGANHE